MCDRTPEVRDAIIAAVPGVDACEAVSAEHLAAITGEFSLREHGITALRAGDFEGLVGITRLNLSRNELTGLPVGVFDGLAGLPKLTLARNALASLPEDVFAGLAALRDLDLWQNQLTTLPVGIFAGLSNLQDLDIEENELVALPAGVFAGLDLRFLGLEGNSLGSLVAGVFRGLRARTLDLSHNGLASLPEGVFTNTDLYELDISVNELRTLPVNLLEGHTRLSVLWMVSNPGAPFTFTMVPRQIPGTTSIVVEVAEGAPFAMTTTISVTGGSLPAGVTSVTIPLGHTRSDEIFVMPVAGEVTKVALGPAPALPENSSLAFGGFSTAVAGPLTLTSPPVTNEPPGFHAIEAFRNVAENTPTDRAIGSAVTATDANGDALTYTLGGPQAGFFGIAPATGQLQTRAALDYERRSTHTLRVTATDPFGAPAVITVTINVQDVDEPLTVAGTTAVTYLQHGTDPAAAYTADDPERATITWDLLGPDQDDFVIANGVLRFVAPPDHENPTDHDGDNVYHVTIRAFAGNHTSTVDATVTVAARLVTPPPTIGPGVSGAGGPSGPTASEIEFEWNVTRDIEELDSDHDVPTGAWSDGTTLWIAENGDGADDAVYAYDLESGERVAEREFELDDANLAPRGVWSDRSTMWISDSGKDKLFAHDLASGERLPDSDLALHPDNDDARGIWSDGSTMWVLDGRDDALFGYDLASGTLLAEYALHDDNDTPHGIFSDGVGVWVSNHDPKRLFAYRLPSIPEEQADDAEALELERVTDEEFTKLPRVSNNSPRGIWSDGEVIYVADASDGKVYSYNMPDAIDARLSSLTLSGVDIGEFSSDTTEYEGVANEGVTETTVEASAVQSAATVAIAPEDSDDIADGRQVALDGLEEVTVTVTSSDESRRRVYRVRFGDAAEDEQLVAPCLRGAVNVGFSLVVYGGGSVDDLVTCAEGLGVTAIHTLDGGAWVSYILGAPEFVNEAFVALYADGLPSLEPLIAKSEGPPSADPAASGEVTEPWPECLRGAIVEGFSLVLYEGGSVDDLDACAQSRAVAALYSLAGGEWVSYILGAPEFVNAAFRELYPDGLAPATPLLTRHDPPSSDTDAGQRVGNGAPLRSLSACGACSPGVSCPHRRGPGPPRAAPRFWRPVARERAARRGTPRRSPRSRSPARRGCKTRTRHRPARRRP